MFQTFGHVSVGDGISVNEWVCITDSKLPQNGNKSLPLVPVTFFACRHPAQSRTGSAVGGIAAGTRSLLTVGFSGGQSWNLSRVIPVHFDILARNCRACDSLERA